MFNYTNIVPSDTSTMAIADYLVQVKLPLDVVAVYGSTSGYVVGGIWMVVDLPMEYACNSVTGAGGKGCLVSST